MLGKEAFNILESLSTFSESGEGITRLFLTKEHKASNDFIEELMKDAGLQTRRDNIGNVIGEYFSKNKNAKTLVIGSHQDTVIHGGKYDGALGVITPIVCFKHFLKENKELNFNLKIISFGDEEGVRFATTYLGSKVVAGIFDKKLLDRKDENGITLKEALINFGLDPSKIDNEKINNIDSYLEIHIEQGPVLEEKKLGVGIVTAIQGSHRYNFTLEGMAGHAGTIPMNMRRDAGIGAAEIICKINSLIKNKKNIVATIGRINFFPGAINVIPGKAVFDLDIRSIDNDLIFSSVEEIKNITKEICDKNNLTFSIKQTNEVEPNICNEEIINLLKDSFKNAGEEIFLLPSGAGHDAQSFDKICKMGMIFVRCKDGISHNPLESVTVEDLDKVCKILNEFFKLY